MLFNSHEYIFAFLPLTFLIYFYLNRKRLGELAKGFLVFSSLLFYSWWNVAYLPLILASLLFNYVLGKTLSRRPPVRASLLVVGISANLALLGYFKYADFLIGNLNAALGTQIGLLELALPLAISFFTFQQIAYLVDSYRGDTHEYDFLNYAVFVTFFPQLIAGPIVHHKEMMPQFRRRRNLLVDYRNVATGLFIFSIGLFKKVAIADTFSVWADFGFASAQSLTLIEAWAASLSYTMQLYFDFSGYTDMAIGAALLFNIRLPLNFDSPYKSTSIQAFWRRWHMTLSRFLRDYIYIPLGGNRRGRFRMYVNLLVTFLLGGLWHGAGWTFVLWGVLHGGALVVHRLWMLTGIRLNAVLAWFITFNFINVSWVVFRAESWKDALSVLRAMAGLNGVVLPAFMRPAADGFEWVGVRFGAWLGHVHGDAQTLVWIAAALLIVLAMPNTNRFLHRRLSVGWMLLAAVLFSYSVIKSFLSSTEVFLYFNF